MASLSSRRVDPGRVARRRRLLVVGLIAFLLVDVVLVGWALSARTPQSMDDAVLPTTPPVVLPSPSPSEEPVVEPEPAEPSAVAAVVPTRSLSAWSSERAWRALSGECPATPASPELTTDGGASWVATDASTPTGTVAVQSISAEGQEVASLVTLSAQDCTPRFIRTYVAGDNYAEYPAELSGEWFVNPANRQVVHSPVLGDVTSPCAVVISVAPRDANSASVLCDDQSVYVTGDGGASWPVSAQLPGAMNVVWTSAGFVVAAVGTTECVGVALAVVANEGGAVPVGCLPLDVEPESLAGRIALSEADGTIWLWAGDVLLRSSDGGVSWV